jgi:hypothetical protein
MNGKPRGKCIEEVLIQFRKCPHSVSIVYCICLLRMPPSNQLIACLIIVSFYGFLKFSFDESVFSL